jgi:hypothetical protein
VGILGSERKSTQDPGSQIEPGAPSVSLCFFVRHIGVLSLDSHHANKFRLITPNSDEPHPQKQMSQICFRNV